MSKLSGRLAEIVTEFLAGNGRLTPQALTEVAWETIPDLLDAESKRLINAQLWKAVRDLVRSTDDEQHELPGLSFPRVIDVTVPDASYLVSAKAATWAELNAGCSARVANVERAQARLTRYRKALNDVRPFMEPFPAKRLREAMDEMGIVDDDPEAA